MCPTPMSRPPPPICARLAGRGQLLGRSGRCPFRAALLLSCVALAGCRWAKAPPLPESTVDRATVAEASAAPFVLGPLDRVRVQVFAHAESSTPEGGVLLDDEGKLDLPLVGPIPLGGLTLDEARERIRTELARFLKDPEVTVALLQAASRSFYLFGEVERTGAYPLDRPLTALQALSLGGGFRPGADREKVALLRGSREHGLEVYFFDGATPGADGLVAVRPDDFLFVRLSGAGTFRDQILPIVQTLVPPITALATVGILVDRLDE